MRFFERTKKLSLILISTSVIFFIMTAIAFSRSEMSNILRYGFNAEKMFWVIIFFIIFIVSLLLGIGLHCVAKDALEDLSNISIYAKMNKK